MHIFFQILSFFSRDFLDVRKNHVDTSNSIYEGYYVSVDSAILPPNPNGKIIRGYNGPNLIRVSKSLTSSKMCIFEWLIDNDVKVLFFLSVNSIRFKIFKLAVLIFVISGWCAKTNNWANNVFVFSCLYKKFAEFYSRLLFRISIRYK